MGPDVMNSASGARAVPSQPGAQSGEPGPASKLLQMMLLPIPGPQPKQKDSGFMGVRG